MYDPPEKSNWVYTGSWEEFHKDDYNRGFVSAYLGGKQEYNPFKPSGYERETTYDDESNYWWYSGWKDFDPANIHDVVKAKHLWTPDDDEALAAAIRRFTYRPEEI